MRANPTSGDGSADGWDTFDIRLPRSPFVLRLFNRAPLVRGIDRVEAVVVALAFVVAVLAVPIAGAIGTAVHDSRSDHYAGQAETRHGVTATITRVPEAPPFSRTGTITAPVEWWADGTQHTATAQVPATASEGDPVELWIGANGAQAFPPAPTSRAAVEGVTAAVAIWISVAAAAAILATVVQLACDRIRFAAWQHDLDSLADNGGGHTTRRP
ncbi:Rv1733c family protein [Mycolicibacterium litorale]|uniref:Rv1733c family protein n=1 Tax=Mycolicibacterium litorale TaxID=758802 RepID=UPI003CF77EB0